MASDSAASTVTGAASAGCAAAKDVLCIHQGPLKGARQSHGVMDQTTITTRPPPEVVKRICQVLEELGMGFKGESEYRYRRVRAKRKKAGGRWGSGLAVWLVRMGWRRLRW